MASTSNSTGASTSNSTGALTSNSTGASTWSSKIIKLRTGDDMVFEVEESVALESELIKRLIEDDCADNVIPMPNVAARIFTVIIDYCKKHAKMKYKLEEDELKSWDKEFAEVHSKDTDELYHLFMASNYLEVKDLLFLIAHKVAEMIKGKSPEEIRKLFKIKNDFTPEEEEEIKKNNSWAFE